MELHDYNNHYNMSLVMIVIMLVSFSSLNITNMAMEIGRRENASLKAIHFNQYLYSLGFNPNYVLELRNEH